MCVQGLRLNRHCRALKRNIILQIFLEVLVQLYVNSFDQKQKIKLSRYFKVLPLSYVDLYVVPLAIVEKR